MLAMEKNIDKVPNCILKKNSFDVFTKFVLCFPVRE
jgi:hypothetical protein